MSLVSKESTKYCIYCNKIVENFVCGFITSNIWCSERCSKLHRLSIKSVISNDHWYGHYDTRGGQICGSCGTCKDKTDIKYYTINHKIEKQNDINPYELLDL